MNMTQELLLLDSEAVLLLKHAESLSEERKKDVDIRSEALMHESKQHFTEQKKSESEQLTKMLKERRNRAMDTLQEKKEIFAKDVEIDRMVEHLLIVAKDRICR
jgi:hypothetical protein